jgi:hypothetical protein
MPMDIGTGILWLIGIIAFFVSLVSICRKILSRFSSNKRDSSLGDLTRPALTILFVVMAFLSVKLSFSKAEKFAYDTACNVQSLCNADNICPEHIPGWNKRADSFACDSEAGYLAKYRVMYDVSDDRKEFAIMLRANIDRNIYFYGGVGKEIQRGLPE